MAPQIRSNSQMALDAYARRLFASPDSYASALLLAAAHLVGWEHVFQYTDDAGESHEPLTPAGLRLDLLDALGFDPGELMCSRLEAMRVAVNTDTFYTNARGFIAICNVLSGSPLTLEFDPADPWEMAWAVAEVRLMETFDGDDMGPDDIKFSEEVRRYMGLAIEESGIMLPPQELRMAIMSGGENVALDLSDTPDLVNAVMDQQQAQADSITLMVQENMAELAAQIKPFLEHLQQSQEQQRRSNPRRPNPILT